MSATYDLATDVGQVRLLTWDSKIADPVHSDEEIVALLALESGVVKLAAALALEGIASDRAQVGKLSVLDTDMDFTVASREIRARAQALRDQAAAEAAALADATDTGAGFEVAELASDVFAARRILANQWLREAG